MPSAGDDAFEFDLDNRVFHGSAEYSDHSPNSALLVIGERTVYTNAGAGTRVGGLDSWSFFFVRRRDREAALTHAEEGNGKGVGSSPSHSSTNKTRGECGKIFLARKPISSRPHPDNSFTHPQVLGHVSTRHQPVSPSLDLWSGATRFTDRILHIFPTIQ